MAAAMRWVLEKKNEKVFDGTISEIAPRATFLYFSCKRDSPTSLRAINFRSFPSKQGHAFLLRSCIILYSPPYTPFLYIYAPHRLCLPPSPPPPLPRKISVFIRFHYVLYYVLHHVALT